MSIKSESNQCGVVLQLSRFHMEAFALVQVEAQFSASARQVKLILS